jgi:dTDP-4-amino-4,6-dideoxygalactose transaminase
MRVSVNQEIPFLDLVTPHLELEEELVSIFRNALRTAGFVGGPMVADFEKEFAQYCGTGDCVGVGSGTDALRFALIASGVGRGDTVVTVPHTFIATTEAISQAGAVPEFVDIDERTYNMDPTKLKAYLEGQCYVDRQTGKPFSKRTQRAVAAILPVHLYGQMTDMDWILGLAARYGLTVIEDACQAHGAEYFSHAQDGWRRAGSMGAAAAFSFFPGKNLGACGEAGAVVTNDKGIAEGVRMLRDHGQTVKYHHKIEGYNGRLDAIQAGVLRIKLGRLPEWNRQRREIADRYNRMFAPMAAELGLPWEPPSGKGAYHLYVVRHPAREELRAHLAEAGIICGMHYPVPLHLQEAYSHLGYRKGDFPVAEKAASEVLSLPIFPQLSHEQQMRIADVVLEFVHSRAQRIASAAGGR